MKYHLGFHSSLSEGLVCGGIELLLVAVASVLEMRLHFAVFFINPSTLSILQPFEDINSVSPK